MLEIKFTPEGADFAEIADKQHARVSKSEAVEKKMAAMSRWLGVPTVVAVFLFEVFLFTHREHAVETTVYALGLVAWCVAIVVLCLRRHRMLSIGVYFRPGGYYCRPKRLTIDPMGISIVSSDGSTSFQPWSNILSIERTGRQFLLYLDDAAVLSIPRRAFATDDEAETFLSTAKNLAEATNGTPLKDV